MTPSSRKITKMAKVVPTVLLLPRQKSEENKTNGKIGKMAEKWPKVIGGEGWGFWRGGKYPFLTKMIKNGQSGENRCTFSDQFLNWSENA